MSEIYTKKLQLNCEFYFNEPVDEWECDIFINNTTLEGHGDTIEEAFKNAVQEFQFLDKGE